jgi:hypothetical protein
LLSSLGLENSETVASFSAESAQRLGLETDGIPQEKLQQALIGHILSADFSA